MLLKFIFGASFIVLLGSIAVFTIGFFVHNSSYTAKGATGMMISGVLTAVMAILTGRERRDR